MENRGSKNTKKEGEKREINIRKALFVFLGLVMAATLVWVGVLAWQNLRGAGPALKEPIDDIGELIDRAGQNETDFPLEVAENFKVEIFARDVPDARVLVQDGFGNFWLSQPDEGTVSLLAVENGEVSRVDPIFRNLDRPHGLAIDPQDGLTLYIAETGAISKVSLYAEGPPEKIADLPPGGRHFSRTIAFGPDGRLYVSIGSSCDTCQEEDDRRAAIYSMERDGSDFKKYADGLRNAVFFDWSYVDGRMWATEMGRDHLGDNLPPDEINIVEEGAFYGWPWYYGKNVRDENFRPGVTPGFARPLKGSHINLQAHVAPLGLAFIPEEGWPESMWYDLIVAFHGSWNRSEPVGYKLARIKLDENGNLESPVDEDTGFVQEEDFISGWLRDDGTALGRPVDILVQPGGIMYVTDDHAGVVYKITYTAREAS